MDEGHRPEAGLRGCTGATGLESVLDRFEVDPQHRPDKRGLMVKETAQALMQGEYQLPYRHLGKHVVHQMCGTLRHAPGVARGTDPAPFAGNLIP